MACRRQEHEASAVAYAFYDNSAPGMGRVQECCNWSGVQQHPCPIKNGHNAVQTGISTEADVEENYYWRRADQPSAYPGWQGAAVGAAQVAATHAFRMADQAGGNVNVHVVVNNLNLHVHQHSATANGTATQGLLISGERGAAPRVDVDEAAEVVVIQAPTQQRHFHVNDPKFHHCTYNPQGLDFGRKVVTRFYRAQKHIHSGFKMITYTQCASTAQALSHALTLYLSHKRSKHAIFVFDCDHVDELTSEWPSIIHFCDIQALIQQLGPDYEYHRCKVKSERFSLYFYVVKRFGVSFSEQGRRTWSSLFQWAHSLQGSSLDNAGSDLSSSQVITQVAAVALSIVGAL